MKRLLRIAGLVCLLGGGTWFGLERIETQSVYPFDANRQTPQSAGLPQVQALEVQTKDETLVVWVSPARAKKPTILYFHGNAGNLANRAGRFRRFLARGYGLVVPAYRGSSGSTGRPSEDALTHDARQIYQNLDKLIAGLPPAQVVVYGESLGTGVALKLIALPDTPQPAGIVLEAPYTSLPDVAVRAYPRLAPLKSRMKNIWNSLDHAQALTAPLLVLHGSDDALIPITMGKKVFAATASSHKTFVTVPGAGHTDIWRSDSLPRLWHFIDNL